MVTRVADSEVDLLTPGSRLLFLVKGFVFDERGLSALPRRKSDVEVRRVVVVVVGDVEVVVLENGEVLVVVEGEGIGTIPVAAWCARCILR